jgi:hypothetical protein
MDTEQQQINARTSVIPTVGEEIMGGTKAEMQTAIDEALEILSEAYTPETSREDLAEAVGRALAVLESDGDSDSDDEDDDGDEDSDEDSDDLD